MDIHTYIFYTIVYENLFGISEKYFNEIPENTCLKFQIIEPDERGMSAFAMQSRMPQGH